jgi:hypothetical protein
MAEIKYSNESHPDVITGIRPTISPAMYTSILCEKDVIFDYFPQISSDSEKSIKHIIKIWLTLKTKTASL